MQIRTLALCTILAAVLGACQTAAVRPQAAPTPTPTPTPAPAPAPAPAPTPSFSGKPVIYQAFTRLYGNQNGRNKPWGTLAENGSGKFGDFSDSALASLKDFGVTHIWYTGVPRHASISDHARYGVPADDPDVVKGRAGSPYAVTDYFDVDPDLATDPGQRLAEFKALVARSHAQGLRVIVDIVPNHVARGYRSLHKPEGVRDFGEGDDTTVEYARDNSFYYIPGQAFRVPEWPEGYRPLGGEPHPLADGQFAENPAKWTGNGSRAAQPEFDDWYETVKINFGVRPDGSHDFDALPPELASQDAAAHAAFWAGRDVPASWEKFHRIVHWWLDLG
ncbi:alpha-amylase family glycosyl hydrolase, partial [Accumulibacter sp.]|uniref:alpha-amylase family glycosyl hydrolase n=1 Tax=Accumulibacter sp. TaxID=2053492 RepID=UPI001AD1D060